MIEDLIKQFGNNKASNIEVFVRPLLLRINLALQEGDLQTAQQIFLLATGIVHDLFGEESDVELQLLQMTITFLLFTVSQMAHELQTNGAQMDANSVNTIKYRSMAYVRQMQADIKKRTELAIKLYGDNSMQYFQLFAEHNMISEQVDEVKALIEGGGTEVGLKNKEMYESTHLAFFKALEAHEKSGQLSPIIERSALWKNMRLENMLKVIKFDSFKLEAYLLQHSAKNY